MHDPSGFREAGTVPRAHLSEAGNSSRCLRQAGLPDVWGRQVSQMSGAGRSLRCLGQVDPAGRLSQPQRCVSLAPAFPNSQVSLRV